MRVLLISTYDLGRQPLGLASPAAWLRRAGAQVVCVDTSRDRLLDQQIAEADMVALYLPMHTATRLAAPLIDRVRTVNARAVLAAYGLYAPLNAEWLRARGVSHVIGPEAEGELAALVLLSTGVGSDAAEPAASHPAPAGHSTAVPRLQLIRSDRSGLPALQRYAALQMPDGSRRVVGSTEATRGCKHLCRHCPIVPVYNGIFRAVPAGLVLDDVRAQVMAGAQHISFGDPDFFNGPTHARRIVEQFAREFPHLTYDVTIKIEHLLHHADMLPLLRHTGCLFVTSAVESVDDEVLLKLRKGHTRADFVRAVALCREAGVTLSPTFVPFTPWTTVEGYVDLLDTLDILHLAEEVAPIQLAIRLLVTAASALLELEDLRAAVGPFDAASLAWPWRHRDPRVDELQQRVMTIVASAPGAARSEVFGAIVDEARLFAGLSSRSPRARGSARVPYMTEAWYCCAEPGPEQVDLV